MNRVSWLDAVEFCKALTVLADQSGTLPQNHEFRLPTEVEWEYACRAGTTTDYYFGEDPAELHEHAWYLVNSMRRVHPVKLKLPNPWGLFDMYGSVREWVGNSFVNTLLDDTEQDEFRDMQGGSYMKTASDASPPPETLNPLSSLSEPWLPGCLGPSAQYLRQEPTIVLSE